MAYGLYTHIASNRRRSIVLLVGLFALVYVLVYAGALAGEALTTDASLSWLLNKAWADFIVAVPFATIGTAIWIAIAWRFHQAMIDAVTGGHDVTRKDEPRLYNLLENLCISRGIPMPKLKIVESDALNAFATGLNEKQYAVSVTTGLLNTLDDAEIEAVLGHELTHIRNGDVRLMVIAVIIAGVISFVAELVFRVGLRMRWSGGSRSSSDGDRGKGGGAAAILIAVVLVALAWFLSSLIRFALSRSREYLADAGAVELTKNPDAMISALRKIEGRGELEGATSAVMELCVDNPRQGFADLFATHPPVDARVAALVKFAGGQDPGPIALPAPGEESSPDETGAADGTQPGDARHGPWGDTPDGPATTGPGGTSAPPPPLPGALPGPLPGPGGAQNPFPIPGPWGPRR
ncbi:peptidase M48 Ste24p [Rhodoplanes elegans]|uniref:Protease HtpX homolog n=2 Tax=Rhodoplanes elegans TaxID=29408 RepID=A0A327KJQ9_9BRAD|nr:peptidase M48 Ste24p [Rhodoplanes elegans]RAI38421.1 peptidase M48 Ste24p [Rhodoplanes elegans]